MRKFGRIFNKTVLQNPLVMAQCFLKCPVTINISKKSQSFFDWLFKVVFYFRFIANNQCKTIDIYGTIKDFV